ncbi:MAG TPA: hypothetical protein VLV87_12085 [Gammaproteobacteria bacterium]|nr:hypothetical protein [Gammaproteobacteria bacterium]
MRRTLMVIGLTLALSPAFAAAPAPILFNDELTAQTRCPLDTVVWLDTHNHHYYFKRSKMYANTAQGGFGCLKEVKEAGNKPGEGRSHRP